MARSHWYFAASTAAVLAAAAIACGDSATGADIPDPDDDDSGSQTRDGGTRDGSVLPNKDSGTSGGTDGGRLDSGTRGDGGLPNVSATALEFGEVDCGTTAAPKTFTIANPSGVAVTFTSELVKGNTSPFTISPPSGSVPAGGSVEVTVTPKAVGTVGVSTNTNALGDTLKLALGPTTAQVDLRQTAHGVRLALGATRTGFGNVSTTAGEVSLPFALANAGNQTAPVTVTFVDDNVAGTSAFSLADSTGTGPVPTTATPGNTAAQVKFQPTDLANYSGKLHVEIGAGVALCDAPPPDLTFTGKGIDAVVGVSAAELNFGNPGRSTTDCGTTAPLQTLKVTNASNNPFTVTAATLGKGTSVFKLSTSALTERASLTNVLVAANSSLDIVVTPQAILPNYATNPTTPDAFADTITLTTNAPGDTPRTIVLHQTARGAYVTRSTNTAPNLGTVAVGTTSAPSTFTWQNLGNVDITLLQSLATGGVFAVTPAELALGVGQAPTVTSVTFTPTATGPATADSISVTAKTPVVMCTTALPGPLAVNGTGGSASIVANNSSTTSTIAFGGIACGTTAPESRALRITNNGAAGTFTAKLRKAISPFVLSSAGGAIESGETVTVQVTPKAVGNDFGTVGEQSDVIEISSTTAANTPAVTVNFTPQGAIVAYTAGTSFAFGNQARTTTSAARTLTVQNNGNVAIPLTFTTTTSSPAAAPNVFAAIPNTFNLQPGAASAQITSYTFTPATNVAYSGALTIASGNGGVLCAPLPQGAPLPATGIATSGVIPLSGTGTN